MTTLTEFYVTLMPAIFAGILNMLWCKLPVCRALQVPMDGERCLRDGKRIFGDNKTWKGFFGMILLGGVCTLLWGGLCARVPALLVRNYLYRRHASTLAFNAAMGLACGLAYALCELPNSFLKRRLGITPGKPCSTRSKPFFVFLDQADSIFGCVAVVCLVYPMSLGFYLLYVLVGAGTHILLNMLLYACHLRKNMF